jgi:hypothetical protein
LRNQQTGRARAQMITRHSAYQHVNRDRLFFEGVYIAVINLCDAALAPLRRRPDIERTLGHLFRGRHFNLYERLTRPPRSVDTLSVKELYAVKRETPNRALNAKLLAVLNARPPALRTGAAAVANSPLVSGFITSVVTARALAKDPELRRERRAPRFGLRFSVDLDAIEVPRSLRAPWHSPKRCRKCAPRRAAAGANAAATATI